MTKNQITIGIPAFNEEKNIEKLIHSLLTQKDVTIDKIIVSSDGSTDNTVKIIRDLKLKKIKLIANPKRMGISRGLNQINSQSQSPILVTLDADIKIKSNTFLSMLIEPIMNGEADLTSSRILEENPQNYLQKALYVSMRLKENLFNSFNSGGNVYTCHGLARAYSKKLYKKIKFNKSKGNDIYSYLYCVRNKFKYKYASKAVAYYKLPNNIEEHLSQSVRFFNSKKIYKNNRALNIPISSYLSAGFRSSFFILKNFYLIVLYLFIELLAKVVSMFVYTPETWTISKSTK